MQGRKRRHQTIVSVVGARPQFVKAAVVIDALAKFPNCQHHLVHTGQHYDSRLSEIFFEELDIEAPEYNLGVGSGSHGWQVAEMLKSLEEVIDRISPDWVMLYGDTNSTLAGALAASKLGIPVAHVESGLRSFRRNMPEEINRVLTDHVSSALFCPTTTSVSNLHKEGLPVHDFSAKCLSVAEAEEVVGRLPDYGTDPVVFLVGDVMMDAALQYAKVAEARSEILGRLMLRDEPYVLATVHRAENTDTPERLLGILSGLEYLSQKMPVLLPVHPRARKAIERLGWTPRSNCSLRLIEPVGYLDMLMLEQHARLIATDSGGVQKEAYFFGIPCAILREETEWTELVESGWSRLVPCLSFDPERISDELLSMLHAHPQDKKNEYFGRGNSCEVIASIISAWKIKE